MSWDRYKRVGKEQWLKQVEAMNAARERKRLAESTADDRPYTAEDQPEIAIQVIIIDHRFDEIIYADLFKKRRIDSFVLAINGQPLISSIGAARAMREIGKRIKRILSPSNY